MDLDVFTSETTRDVRNAKDFIFGMYERSGLTSGGDLVYTRKKDAIIKGTRYKVTYPKYR